MLQTKLQIWILSEFWKISIRFTEAPIICTKMRIFQYSCHITIEYQVDINTHVTRSAANLTSAFRACLIDTLTVYDAWAVDSNIEIITIIFSHFNYQRDKRVRSTSIVFHFQKIPILHNFTGFSQIQLSFEHYYLIEI